MASRKIGKPVRGSKTGRPIMVLLDLLGQRWTLRILWELKDGRLTFRQLQERCDQVSPTSLNNRLKELRDMQIIDHEGKGYGFTELGSELASQLAGLSKWSEDWSRTLGKSNLRQQN